jgi:hypothetical protein
MRPLPTVQFEPPDLTSSVGASSIRVDVYNLGDAVGADVLSAVANQIHLYEWPGGREVAVTTTGHDVDGPKYGMDGYKRNESAYVSVQPVTPLTDQWYIVKLLSLPSRVTAPTSKAHLMLPDGTMGARFAPGSHPVVAGLRICDKGQGNAIAMLDFSERVNYVPGAATVDLVGGNSNYCTPDPSIATVGTSQSIRFLCGGLPPAGSHLKISVPATVTSPSGGSLEVPGKGRGDVVSQISADGMQVWGTGCTFSRPF